MSETHDAPVTPDAQRETMIEIAADDLDQIIDELDNCWGAMCFQWHTAPEQVQRDAHRVIREGLYELGTRVRQIKKLRMPMAVSKHQHPPIQAPVSSDARPAREQELRTLRSQVQAIEELDGNPPAEVLMAGVVEASRLAVRLTKREVVAMIDALLSGGAK